MATFKEIKENVKITRMCFGKILYLPPIAYSPSGTPNAIKIYNTITIPNKKLPIKADIIPNLLILIFGYTLFYQQKKLP